MKKYILLLFFFVSFCTLAQTNQSWGGYFSYNHIIGLAESDSRIVAATENAVFSKHLATHEIETFNTIDGLKTDKITAIYHSNQFNLTLIGNDNGLLVVVNLNNKNIINKVDILNDVPVLPNKKKINHFFEHEGKVFISTDYGISVFNLETLEFGDTFFIGESGQQTQVLQTTVYNNEIYAVTKPFGIRRASLSNPNLIHFNAWDTFHSANWNGIVSIENHLVSLGADGILYRLLSGGGTSQILNTNQSVLGIKSVNGYLTVTTSKTIYVLSSQLAVVAQIGQIFDEPVEFTDSTVILNTVYIGTTAKALYAVNLNNLSSYQNYIPAGPLRNKVYSITATADDLWCVFGDNSHLYNPYFPELGRYGISKFTPEGWLHIPYEEVLEATNLSKVVITPNNENKVYIGSNHSGILIVENNIPTMLLNATNTGQNGLEGFAGGNSSSIRIHNMAFDKNGNLWVTNAGNTGKLKVMQGNNSWKSYQIHDKAASYGDLVIDKNGTKWVATHDKGLVGFNEAYQNRKIVIDDSYDNGVPYNRVATLAIDNNNRLWVGTALGLRVLPSVDRFLTEDQLNLNPIIIMDDGLAQELLYRQSVKKIKVNGADQKWIGTIGSGVFLVSSNGQETIHHFTKDNSPLPSNNILDIDINPRTGEVFFATDKGMVSYKGTATSASENLGGVYVYPNPVRPEYIGTVKIAGLTDKANVKITDIEGNLVYEAKSEGGTIEWDTTAFGKYRVASGVYMIFITTQDASETKVKKVMIVR